MGRSKFPGKPSKHVNKKRVNVLPYSVAATSGSQGHEPGSQVANGGVPHDAEQAVTFSGFSTQEVDQAARHVEAQHRELRADDDCQQSQQPQQPAAPAESVVMPETSMASGADGAVTKPAHSGVMYKSLVVKPKLKSIRSKRIVRVCEGKEAAAGVVTRKPVYNVSTRRQQAKLCRGKPPAPASSPASLRTHDKEATSLVGKFVLPSRSLHSSRVIKPNKRFINTEQIHNITGADFLSKNIKKVKVVEKCKSKGGDYASMRQRRKCPSALTKAQRANLAKKEDGGDVPDSADEAVSPAAGPAAGPATTWPAPDRKDTVEAAPAESSNSAGGSWSCGKLVLRKARLQLHTHSSESTDGPFSSYSTATVNPPGTVTCGVCGAVRFYRFVKQARKFNIYSCESCRKFISKMIKRQACSKTCAIPTLVCHKGQGMCHVPPIVRSQQWKLIRCAYKARCPACWLKMCLRSFQMPAQLKMSLTNLLPENMRPYVDQNTTGGSDPVALRRLSTSSRQLLAWQPLSLDPEVRKTRSLLRDKTDKLIEKFVSPLKIDILSYKNDTASLSNNRKKKHRKTRLVRKKSVVKPHTVSATAAPEATKRQKIDLKGPRVKHVCRSASIVLGQPLATFANDTAIAKKKEASCERVQDQDSCVSCSTPPDESSAPAEKEEASLPTKSDPLEERISNTMPRRNGAPIVSRKNLKPAAAGVVEVRVQNGQKRGSVSTPEVMISTEFWENYDPDEVCQTGFGIIGSETFPVQIVCFLCGSAGQEQLIHCASCCEPYHLFCLDGNQLSTDGIGSLPLNDPNWRFNWTCARCTTCHSCRISVTKEKVNCQKCHKYYHPQCLNSKWKNSDRPMICSSCLRCKSCGSENITKFVCNLPLCASCFKLRKKGNFCPLCQRCYDDNDFDIKMMECGECKRWVHAKCEGLSDEKYQVLSYLPESVAFVCRICSKNIPSHWQDAMEAELKNNYHNVLRSLSKNRTARELLKWSPMKNHTCSCQPVEFSKKISFSDSCEELDGVNDTSEIIRRNSGKNINNLREALQCDIDDESSQDSRLDDVDSGLDSGEQNVEFAMRTIKKKFCLKECSVRIKHCAETKEKCLQLRSRNGNLEMDSEDKEYNLNYDKNDAETCVKQELFHCNRHDTLPITSLLDIKKKVNSNFYKTLKEFQRDVEDALKKASCEQLLVVLQNIMKEVFPWYDPTSLSISETGDLNKNNVDVHVETDMVQHISNNLMDLEIPAPKFKGIPEDAMTKYSYGEATSISDTRICVLCKGNGDGIPSLEERLLYCGQNDWVHANCALWSPEVFEEIDGSLQNVHSAISRGRMIRCGVCKQKGASIGCCAKCCSETYHYTCARALNCYFMHDKTVYCPSHFDLAFNKALVNGKEFEILRPIYVELDGKKKKYIEPSKAQYLIGSLTVTSLGKFFHPLSDNEESIIPSEFVCTRLFWSTVEPWKIVRYTISTSILMPKERNYQSCEKHFTVDHTMSQEIVDKSFDEIARWSKMLESDNQGEKSTNDNSLCCMDDEKVVAQVLEHVLELICTKEVEENCDDEPQNTADLLPPELKDAIFEDLPHDLLDGISMQDIFPKLMSYEDIITMDLKTSEIADNDFLKDPKTDLAGDIMGNVDGDDFSLQSQFKGKKDLFMNENDLWLEPKCAIQGLDDYVQSKINPNVNSPELKRSKSEIFPGMKKLTRNRNHQRSCSLTWSCKLDNSLANNIKKRKVSCAKNVSDFSNNLFMVVDGTGEKGMLQELRLPDGVLMTMGRSTNSDCVTDTMRELKYRLEENTALPGDRCRSLNQQLEQGKENKCRIWQSRSQSRILQVDGADDYSSSESESLSHEPEANSATLATDEPVKCDRCQCTYRTMTSYNRHLTTCDLITSESDSDVPLDNEKVENHCPIADNTVKGNEMNQVEYHHEVAVGSNSYVASSTQMSISNPQMMSVMSTNQHATLNGGHVLASVQTQSHVESSNHKQSIQLIQQNFQNTISCSPVPVPAPVAMPVAAPITTTVTAPVVTPIPAPMATFNPVPSAPVVATFNVENVQQQVINTETTYQNIQVSQNHLNHAVSNGQQNIALNGSVVPALANTDVSDMNQVSVALVPPVQKQVVNKFRNSSMRGGLINSRGRGRPARQIVTKRLRPDKPIQIISQSQSMPANNTIRLTQQNSPTVIIQHLSSPNLMPAYVEAFQQQTGQNLQCIATIVPEYKPPPTPSFLTSNSIVPGTFQIQSTEPTNVISLPNNGLSMVPGLQIAQHQPAVMGTIIQQQRPAATIQCGMMTTEQLLLGSAMPTMPAMPAMPAMPGMPTMPTMPAVPSMQSMQSMQSMPTVPTVDTIVTDPSGSMYITSQPVYYGFETIVQNTVMQSQQFMSTTLPGVLASNSSYSATTTQVFQASKIEPVVEINGSSYILVNPAMSQVAAPLTVNTQPVITPLSNRPASIIAAQPTMHESQPSFSVQLAPILDTQVQPMEPVKYSERLVEQPMTAVKSQPVTTVIEVPTAPQPLQAPKPTGTGVGGNVSLSSNSITLPMAPYATENGIPMNIVNPIPQVSTSAAPAQTSRPMNRVLPMQTAPQRDFQKARSPVNKVISLEPPEILNKLSETVDKIQETLNSDAESMQSTKLNTNDNLLKLESASLKLVFQKQSQDGIYKISNKYISKNNIPIQVVPMKQTKSKTVETVINVRSNVPIEKKEVAQDKPDKQATKHTSENNPNILYKVHSEDGFNYSSTSLTELWAKIFEAVQNARALHNMPPLPQDALNMMNGLQLMGLKSNGLRYLVEQLPGAARCVKYKPSFHKKLKIFDQDSNVQDGHSQGAIRCQAHTNRKEPYDMFSWLASRHRKPEYILQVDSENTSRRVSSINLPMAMRFRQLKETSKQAVGVYRSNIHGRGLFCLRDIESGEMVIEYAGEVIRSTLTDKREKYYNSKGIGCYMFRVDDNLVVDATMKGNAARFINHSCDPNCYSRVLEILGHKHILIFALRKIMQGEELTYDYKFPFEEDKIPCTCGSKRCRKYLN